MSESLPLYWAYSLASQAQGLTLTAAPQAIKEVLLSIVWEQKPITDGPLLSSEKTPLISVEQGTFTSPYQLIASPSQPSPGQRQWLKLVLPDTPAITQFTLAPVSAWFSYLKLRADQQQVVNYRGLFAVAAGAQAPSISAFAADLDFWPALKLTAAATLTPLPEAIGLGIDFHQDSVQQALAKLEERLHYRNLEREHTAHSIQALNANTEQHQAQLSQLSASVKENRERIFDNNLLTLQRHTELNDQLTATQADIDKKLQQLETTLTDKVTSLEQQQLAYSKAMIDVQQQLLDHAVKIFSDIND